MREKLLEELRPIKYLGPDFCESGKIWKEMIRDWKALESLGRVMKVTESQYRQKEKIIL